MAKTPPKLRVMVDANVLLSGIVWPRWPWEVLRHAVSGDFQLVLSETVIRQARRRISIRFPEFLDEFERFLSLLEYELAKEPAKEEIDKHRSLVRDITDVPVALAAMNSKVDFLVSEDKDLTAKDETTEELRKHVKVFIAGTFLREVMGWESETLEKVRKRTWKDLHENEIE
jgi:putative PIN family toxin of toxin-antitoxin system